MQKKYNQTKQRKICKFEITTATEANKRSIARCGAIVYQRWRPILKILFIAMISLNFIIFEFSELKKIRKNGIYVWYCQIILILIIKKFRIKYY